MSKRCLGWPRAVGAALQSGGAAAEGCRLRRLRMLLARCLEHACNLRCRVTLKIHSGWHAAAIGLDCLERMRACPPSRAVTAISSLLVQNPLNAQLCDNPLFEDEDFTSAAADGTGDEEPSWLRGMPVSSGSYGGGKENTPMLPKGGAGSQDCFAGGCCIAFHCGMLGASNIGDCLPDILVGGEGMQSCTDGNRFVGCCCIVLCMSAFRDRSY